MSVSSLIAGGCGEAREVRLVSGYAEIEGIAPELARLTKPFRNAELAASIAALVPEAPTG
jgi:hypothetical protein